MFKLFIEHIFILLFHKSNKPLAAVRYSDFTVVLDMTLTSLSYCGFLFYEKKKNQC